MRILGVSGSPILGSNTDRAVKTVLKATGEHSKFVRLADFNIAPCDACLGCVTTNKCIINDDGNKLAEWVKQADALVVGGFTPYSTLDSRTKAFLERLYPLRHQHGYLAQKLGAAVITSAIPAECDHMPPAAELGVNAIQYFMMEEGMHFVGSVTVSGNVPCIKCGNGNNCAMSGIKMLHGDEATVESAGINVFNNQPEAVKAAKTLGENLAKAFRKTG
jgi:multimeric flavodoxin WrbA